LLSVERKALIEPSRVCLPGILGIFALLLFCLCPAIAAWAGAPESLLITHGPRELPRIALTFDLCQVPARPSGFDRQIVDFLEREKVAATFFAGGDWLRTHPEEARRLTVNPRFELGNHSWGHPDLRRLSAGEIAGEIERTEAELIRVAGRTSRLFRLPFGTHTPASLQAAAAQGVRIIQWDVVTGDPDPGMDAAAIIKEVQRGARNGSIIIMHANGRGWHTAEALPQMIAWLRGRGFELVTVSELLGPAPSSPAGTQ
jgi:peptidoglycan/xylan/chitin deacetylase (PgdA/CDA1 family)